MRYYLLIFIVFAAQLSAKISALYLTWQDDPTTTMDIHWHSPKHGSEDAIYLQKADGDWEEVTSTHQSLRYLHVHTVRLKSLEADKEYSFRVGRDPKLYKFRTAPRDLNDKMRFIVGGDADQNTNLFRKMNETIVKKDPLFCVIGGDIAYAVGSYLRNLPSYTFNRWMSFLSIWKEQMVTPEGRLIPLIVVPGNHDILDTRAELFSTLFPSFEKRLYRTLDFSNYLSLILLDTDHVDPIDGAQAAWLGSSLSDRENMLYRFAIYHVAAYPSFYPYDGKIPKQIREFWCPLFDKYALTAAFENHNHTYKKTHPLKDGKVDPDGMIYFGDGCWGAVPRPPKDLWYLAEKGRKNNVYLIELTPKTATVDAIDLEGELLDSSDLSPSRKH